MKDDNTPATKADIHRLDTNIQRLDGRVDRLETAIGQVRAELKNEMREMAKSLNAAIDQVLTVLVNIDKRLTASLENHERRITRLEARIGIDA